MPIPGRGTVLKRCVRTAQRLSQRIAYLDGAAFAERAASDYRYKGEVIRALDIKVE